MCYVSAVRSDKKEGADGSYEGCRHGSEGGSFVASWNHSWWSPSEPWQQQCLAPVFSGKFTARTPTKKNSQKWNCPSIPIHFVTPLIICFYSHLCICLNDYWPTVLRYKNHKTKFFLQEIIFVIWYHKIQGLLGDPSQTKDIVNLNVDTLVFLMSSKTNVWVPWGLGMSSLRVWELGQDTELAEQINRDVKRTHPDMDFFCGPTAYAYENQVSCYLLPCFFFRPCF